MCGEPSEEHRKNHSRAIRADHIILIAKTQREMQPMLDDISKAFEAAGFEWKPKALEVMGCGDLADSDENRRTLTVSVNENGKNLVIPQVRQTEVL